MANSCIGAGMKETFTTGLADIIIIDLKQFQTNETDEYKTRVKMDS